LTFFPASKPQVPPLSVVLTLWLSTTPAVGLASRPSSSRPAITRWLLIIRHIPPSRQSWKWRCTVEGGGESFGSMRHWQPAEAMYRIAFATSRRSVVRGRPCRRGGGRKGAIGAHSRFVRSLA
jgi:hypothetical protein